jgi:hypothetical protein
MRSEVDRALVAEGAAGTYVLEIRLLGSGVAILTPSVVTGPCLELYELADMHCWEHDPIEVGSGMRAWEETFTLHVRRNAEPSPDRDCRIEGGCATVLKSGTSHVGPRTNVWCRVN